MSFYAKDLDGAYYSLSELSKISKKDGQILETSLKDVIANLCNHWKGNDANIHINGLMKVCKGLDVLLNEINIIVSSASGSVVKAQEIRNMNGFNGNVGVVIPCEVKEPLVFEELGVTAEYYVDPVGAPADYNSLCNACLLFDNFISRISEVKGALLEHWISGDDRERAVAAFDEFESNVTGYKASLNKAKDDLQTAVTNLKNIEQA